jgi:hypothetical protein
MEMIIHNTIGIYDYFICIHKMLEVSNTACLYFEGFNRTLQLRNVPVKNSE